MNQTAPFPSEAVTPVFTVAPEAGVSPAGSSSGRESVDVAAARTLATVLEVAEVQEASKLRPVPAVHLRVQVGGETVGITVELRDQGVQAQFSAASPELREALTREWQAVQLETREGAPRLLDPVFPSSAGGSATAHDQGGAASRQQQQAHPGLFPWTQAGAFSARRARPAAATAADTPPALSPDSRLLSAVA